MNSFQRQFGWELVKLFARKRTYIGFGAFFVVELALQFLFRLEKVKAAFVRLIERNGYAADFFFSGITVGFFILLWTVFLLGALYLALVGGDVVSKEVEEGTMRMLLCRPASRQRILSVKYLAIVVYTAALTVFITVTALLTGLSYRGLGGLFVYAPLEKIFALHGMWDGLARMAGAIPLLSLSLLTISSLAFFLSCTNMKPAAATIVTLSFFFMDSILRNIPFFESYQHLFFTSRMAAWIDVFRQPIPWHDMAQDYIWMTTINLTLFLAGVIVFSRRDFKS